ncbi:MAG: transglutaminase-like domain-containing protein [Candidatus Edwardsbacteria bacterium]
MKRLWISFVVIFWLIMIGFLIYKRNPLQKSIEPPLSLIKTEKGSKENWMGIYLNDQKIGYSMIVRQTKPSGVRFVFNRSSMRLPVMGVTQEVTTITDYTTNKNYVLQDFYFELISREHSLKAKGKVSETRRSLGGKERKLLLDISSAGETQQQTIPLEEEIYLPDALEPLIVQKGLKPGTHYTFKAFDPTTFNLAPIKITVIGNETCEIKKESYQATKLQVTFLGLNSDVWVDSEGNTLKEEGPMGMTTIKEDKEEALKMSPTQGSFDILTAFSVPVEGEIKKPREISYLKIQIDGIPLETGEKISLGDDRQKIVQLQPLVLEINREEAEALDVSEIPVSIHSEALQSSPLIQSNDERIRSKALEIVDGEKNAFKVSERLVDWVYKNISKRPTISIPSALEVLETLEGDCNEHATLFTALGRSLGLPTKICVGLVYQEGRFYYHAWNLVYVGKWIAVDPTFGQLLADASHIKLLEGELSKQVELLSLIGHLKVKIYESSPN